MSCRRVAKQAVNDTRLCGVQRNPVDGRVLQCDKEPFNSFLGFLGKLISVPEFDLERKLPDERPVLSAGAPERHVRLGYEPGAKVDRGNILKDLLDDGVVD